MIFLSLGDTDDIGASCHFVKVQETGILLDAGADPEEDGPNSLPRFDLIRQNTDWYVDHVVVTHAHHDHVGALPNVIQQFPHVLVHMTPVTRDLTEYMLLSSMRLQKRKFKEGSSAFEPLYNEEELGVYSYLYLTHELGTDFNLTGIRPQPPITARFYNAGHILGAAGVLLSFEEGGASRRLFYTSDTNMRSQFIIPGGEYPEEPVDVLVLESTLAADPEAELTTRRAEEERFAEAVAAVVKRGGSVLVPAFALGRAQEILALIDRYKKRGVIPDEVPVYTAGSMRAVADLYDKTRYVTPRLNPDFQVFGVEQKRLPRGEAAKLAVLGEPGIHIAGSGMMFERTLSYQLAQQMIGDEKNAVFFVGFAKEDSPAHRLMEAGAKGKGAEVILSNGAEPQVVNCEVQRFRFSGHSHRRDLIEIVEMLKPKKIVLVHGEASARTWMSDNLRFFYPDTEVYLPEHGVPLEL